MVYDFKRDWPKLKKQLMAYSKEALTLAQKGEKEIVRLSRVGKLHFDTTTLELKKERLYYLIGREFVRSGFARGKNKKLNNLIEELKKIESDQKLLKRKFKSV